MAQDGLAAVAEQTRMRNDAERAARGQDHSRPTPRTKRGAIHPSLGGLRKPAPAAKYVPNREKSDAEKEESRKAMAAELAVRQRNKGQ